MRIMKLVVVMDVKCLQMGTQFVNHFNSAGVYTEHLCMTKIKTSNKGRIIQCVQMCDKTF